MDRDFDSREEFKFDISPWPLMGLTLEALHTVSIRMQELKEQVEKEAREADRAYKNYEFMMERLKTLNNMSGPAHWYSFDQDRRLPRSERERFGKARPGVTMYEKELDDIEEPWNYITVGDTTSETFRRHGLIPALSIYDGKTKREETSAFSSLMEGLEKTEVCNPPGMLTAQLFKAIARKVTNIGGLIHVDGEEDLAVLPCIALAPEGYTVVYGDPGAGAMVRVEVNDGARREALELMDCMECLKSHENVEIYKKMKKRLEGKE